MMRSSLTVTSVASSYDLTDLDTVKEELGITNDSEDAKLQRWITQASKTAAKYCKRVLLQETVSETFRADRLYPRSETVGFLSLSRYPVASITSVTEDSTALESSAYSLDAAEGFLNRLSGNSPCDWSFCESIVVVYVAGYAADAIPEDLEAAVISMVRDLRSDTTRDPNLIEQEIEGVARYRWGATSDAKAVLPVEISGLLDPYVRRFGWMI